MKIDSESSSSTCTSTRVRGDLALFLAVPEPSGPGPCADAIGSTAWNFHKVCGDSARITLRPLTVPTHRQTVRLIEERRGGDEDCRSDIANDMM